MKLLEGFGGLEAGGGFGDIGTKVFGDFLYDGEDTHFHRGAFIGIADESKLPDWALERLEEIRTEIDEGETQSLS